MGRPKKNSDASDHDVPRRRLTPRAVPAFSFEVSDYVVLPGRGLHVFARKEALTIQGQDITVYEFRSLFDNSKTGIKYPEKRIPDSGIRKPASREEILDAIKMVMPSHKYRPQSHANQDRRISTLKLNLFRAATLEEVAAVARDTLGVCLNGETSYSNREIGEAAIRFLAHEMAFDTGLRFQDCNEHIQHLMRKGKGSTSQILPVEAGIRNPERMTSSHFKEVFGMSISQASDPYYKPKTVRASGIPSLPMQKAFLKREDKVKPVLVSSERKPQHPASFTRYIKPSPAEQLALQNGVSVLEAAQVLIRKEESALANLYQQDLYTRRSHGRMVEQVGVTPDVKALIEEERQFLYSNPVVAEVFEIVSNLFANHVIGQTAFQLYVQTELRRLPYAKPLKGEDVGIRDHAVREIQTELVRVNRKDQINQHSFLQTLR